MQGDYSNLLSAGTNAVTTIQNQDPRDANLADQVNGIIQSMLELNAKVIAIRIMIFRARVPVEIAMSFNNTEEEMSEVMQKITCRLNRRPLPDVTLDDGVASLINKISSILTALRNHNLLRN